MFNDSVLTFTVVGGNMGEWILGGSDVDELMSVGRDGPIRIRVRGTYVRTEYIQSTHTRSGQAGTEEVHTEVSGWIYASCKLR